MEKKQSTGDIRLSYIKEGKGDVLLFIHGFCGSKEYWKDLVPLLKKDYTVICADLRGHGGTGCPDENFNIDDLARDLYYFLSQQSLDKVYLFGHSLGGYVTLAFAELFPAKLKGFSLIHSTAFPDSEMAQEARRENIQLINEKGVPALVDRIIPALFSKDSLASLRDKVSEVKQIGYGTSSEGARGALKAMMNRPNRNQVLLDTQKPVLIVAGEKDKIIPPDKAFSAEGSHIRPALLSNAGHMGMVEAPEELSEIIKDWIKVASLKE